MLKIEDIIAAHKKEKAEHPIIQVEDRFGRRLVKFLTEEQMKELDFELKDEFKGKHVPIPYTEENVLKQLKEDVLFGWEKACNHRGISASLMFEVVRDWCKVLQNEFADFSNDNYAPYGTPLFIAVSNKYGFGIDQGEFDDGDWS